MKLYKPLVSVIINCYNGERFLDDTLKSVLQQDYEYWEIIFWDNCSTDKSAEIFKKYSDKRFKYFLATEHRNLAHAKASAVEQACGDWLGFLDADDVWFANKLSKQVKIIERSAPQVALIYGRMELILESEPIKHSLGNRVKKDQIFNRKRKLPEGNIFNQLTFENFIPQPSILIKKKAYFDVGGVDVSLKFAWDYDLTLKITKKYLAKALNEKCCGYRIHGSNLSQTQSKLCFEESILALKKYQLSPSICRGIEEFKLKQFGNFIRNQDYSGALFILVNERLYYPLFLKVVYIAVKNLSYLIYTFKKRIDDKF